MARQFDSVRYFSCSKERWMAIAVAIAVAASNPHSGVNRVKDQW